MPRLPKRSSDRRSHHQKGPTTTLLSNGRKIKTPTLPPVEGEWHRGTLEWWNDSISGIWSSPMGAELVDADLHGLRRLAFLVDGFHTAGNIRDRMALAAEIRLQSQAYGLDPQARRKLGWVVETPRASNAVERFLRKEDDETDYRYLLRTDGQ